MLGGEEGTAPAMSPEVQAAAMEVATDPSAKHTDLGGGRTRSEGSYRGVALTVISNGSAIEDAFETGTR
jgi:hypothetical protein